ncbi:conserved hypothetical protein [Leishmania mexicana MHOM/GT/2001/U1103]|uniref:Uncharacterized protein n=1 Tax=Leishmania mexicana (strain MHOM/GT/2001/U1103) TaxID=929439 RepID=E9AZS4_LEIMU|nr:conserved hypothetical protein [Leishmania mexicana MHOM/GT/2001/U1103]CBZ28475.1 conserved hypothetical protein [Leishmania mexicana MHOM/GT/2001/U1103]
MRRLAYAASVVVPPYGRGEGGGHSTPAWMRNLLSVRLLTRRPMRNRPSSCSSRGFTLQGDVWGPVFLQHRRVASRTTPGDATASAEKRSPREEAFEEALYKDFAHLSLVRPADTVDATSSSEVAYKNIAIRAAPRIEDRTPASGAVAREAPEDRASAGVTGSETLPVKTGAKPTPVAQPPRVNPGRSSDMRNPPLLPSVSGFDEERRTHLTTELAFEQALYGGIIPVGDGDGGATDSHSTTSIGSTSNTPTARATGEAAGASEEYRQGCAAVSTGAAAPVSSDPFSRIPGHLLRGDSAELSKGAPPPWQAARRNEDESQPASATTVTTPRVTFASAEAAFERALYGDVMTEPLSGKADVLVSNDASMPEAGRDGSASPGAPPLPPAPSATPDTLDSARPYRDGSAADALVRRADDAAPDGAMEGTPALGMSEPDTGSTPEGREDVRQLVDNAADKEVSDAAEAKGAESVAVEKAIPPPTVSMRCALDLDRLDAPADQFALFDALFRVTDHHTAVVTHIDPADRVRRCMPLLDRISKRELFFASGWILDLERAEDTNAAPPRTERAAGFSGSAAPLPFTHREVVGRSKVLRTLVFRLLHAQHHWWDQVQEVVLLAVRKAAALETSCPAVVGDSATGEDTPPTSSDDGVEGATASVVVPASGAAAVDRLLRHTTAEDVQAAMTRIFGTDPQQVHFFSDALCEALATFGDTSGAVAGCVDGTFSAFEGPVAAWNAFVLTQRHRTTGVCGAHRRPFSFGEGRPTINISDLAPLQYCEGAASWSDAASPEPLPCVTAARHSTDARTTDGDSQVDEAHVGRRSTLCTPSADAAAADPTTMAWDTMSEEEQNTFLFGAESAQLSLRVRESGGVYAVFGQHNIPFEMESMLAEAELVAQQREALGKEETEADAADGGGIHVPAEASLLEVMRDQEAAHVRAYDVDRVVLELMNSEGATVAAPPGGRSSFLSSLAAASNERSGSTSRQQRARGRIGTTAPASTMPFQWQLRNNEDVQLAALWQRFVRASTGDLIGNLVYVRRHASSLVHDAVVDIAVQKAFWLLFFARDEVRAVTHPKRTYETLWNLHHQLVALFALPHGDGSPPSPTPRRVARGCEDAQAARPTFEDLSLHSQVSYACFGCAHVPPRPSSLVTEAAGVGDKPHIHSSVSVPYASPTDLYAALAGSYNGHGAGQLETGAAFSTSADGTQSSGSETENFTTLSALQQSAIDFCFPRNGAERDEAALFLPAGGGPTVAVAAMTTALETANTERDPQNEQGESSPDAGSYPASEGEPLNDDERTQPGANVRQRAARARKVRVHGGAAADDDAWIRQVHSALEGSVYECLRSLRAAGVLAAPLPSYERRRDNLGVTLATFSDEQRRKVWRAVQDITAAMIEGDAVESSVGASSLARDARVPTKVEDNQHRMPSPDAAMADALASPQKKNRKAMRSACSLGAPDVSMGHYKRHQASERLMTSDMPLRRKRGRKPRTVSFDAIESASEEREATAPEQTRHLSKPSRQRGTGRRGRKGGAARRECGVTNEEVAHIMALFREGET